MTTIAISGASGPYASLVREELLERGFPVEQLVLITRRPEALERLRRMGASVRQGDFDEPGTLTRALEGVDEFLMVSTSKVGSREEQHGNAVRSAAAAGVARIVYTSYIGKDSGNPSLAVADHRLTETLIRHSGVPYVFLRNAQYMDAITDAVGPHFIREGLWKSAAGSGRMGIVRRADCAAAAAGVLTGAGATGAIYDITGPALLSFAEMAAVLSEVSGRPIEYRPISEEEMYADFDARGIPRQSVPGVTVDGVPWSSDDIISVDRAMRGGFMEVLSDHVEVLSGNAPWSFLKFAYDRADLLKAIS